MFLCRWAVSGCCWTAGGSDSYDIPYENKQLDTSYRETHVTSYSEPHATSYSEPHATSYSEPHASSHNEPQDTSYSDQLDLSGDFRKANNPVTNGVDVHEFKYNTPSYLYSSRYRTVDGSSNSHDHEEETSFKKQYNVADESFISKYNSDETTRDSRYNPADKSRDSNKYLADTISNSRYNTVPYKSRPSSGDSTYNSRHSTGEGAYNTRYSEVSTRISVGHDNPSTSSHHNPASSRSSHQYGKTDRASRLKSDRKKVHSGEAGEEKPLRLHGVAVPVYKFREEDAQLECQYDEGTDPLYSVKWYKDDDEFFRYLYGQERPKQVFDVPGVIVDITRSNEKRVLLQKLSFASTGIYRCEVSADSPHFRTYTNQSVMVVVELPSQPPTITGGRSHYKVGDTAHLNCTSARSKPAPTLTWFINGVEAAPHQLEQYYPWVHRDQLESKRLGLTFQVQDEHYLDKVQDEHFDANGELEVRCRATVSAVYREGGAPEAMPVVLEHREGLIRARNGSSCERGSRCLAVMALAVVLANLLVVFF
ncbi:uncharacterized protein LOC125177607 [Hyalella azteca]|uniref:Uncharacterized protein LOC125177607 n=1 Tax=Hyalella azteca TaxID=294128 RepID=A0A979FFB6_HYAAZ|nr:uncharacterized protein LOC125177607 [Hyalella azteca]